MSARDRQGRRKLVRWETHTWTGSGEGRYNEDYAAVDGEHGCAVVVDGATGLTKINLVAGESDAAWYARNLALGLCDLLPRYFEDPRQALLRAGESVARAYRRFEGAKELQRIDQPNGSVAAFVWDDARVKLVLLGDCTAAVQHRDGEVVAFHDDTLTRLDNQNYQRMLSYAQSHGASMAEARRALNDRFIENRLKMNQPGGYWAADISCDGMLHADVLEFDARDVVAVFACSDGYAAAQDMGVMSDASELARHVMAGEGVALGELLRAAEHADQGCWQVPRSKTSDDATFLFAELGLCTS